MYTFIPCPITKQVTYQRCCLHLGWREGGNHSQQQADQLEKRFAPYEAWDMLAGEVNYGVSCDTHAFDVYDDEFVATGLDAKVDSAMILADGELVSRIV